MTLGEGGGLWLQLIPLVDYMQVDSTDASLNVHFRD